MLVGELVEHLRAEYRLSLKRVGECSLRAHLDQVWRATGQRPAELETPPPPRTLEYIARWYEQLAARRSHDMGTPQPLTATELESWSRLTATPVRPWEAQLLFVLDDLWLCAWAAGQPKPAQRSRP